MVECRALERIEAWVPSLQVRIIIGCVRNPIEKYEGIFSIRF